MIGHDIIIIGGGQMGLALGYYLRRAGLDFLILDSEDGPGGAWRHGNSGAQILAELSQVADVTWVTLKDPLFLPDDVDGRVLFERATARLKAAPGAEPVGGIGDIVMVPPVRAARERGVLGSVRPFVRLTKHGVVWEDGRESQADAIIWCTGFRAALDHLRPLGMVGDDGRVEVEGQRATREPRLWLAGYGDWCGPGSATIMGAARTARDLAAQIVSTL